MVAVSIPMNVVNASNLTPSDFAEHPEKLCIYKIDEPEWKDLCEWINICDDTGEVNVTHIFCAGEAVSDPPGPDNCPEGYYAEEEDESGLCYTNENGCRSEQYIMNREQNECNYIIDACQEDPTLERCTVTINLGTPENEATYYDECEHSVPDFCIEPSREGGYMQNGTWDPGVHVYCHDLNMTDFRVTVADRHNFDQDYDGIGCEQQNN